MPIRYAAQLVPHGRVRVVNRLLFILLLPLLAVAFLPLNAFAQARPGGRPRPVTRPRLSGERLRLSESPVVSRQLANGLQVLVYEDHSVPLVTVEYSAVAGSLVEKPEENGFSHLIEHMFWKMDPDLLKKNYGDNIGRLGITYNGTTHEEMCSEYLTATSDHFALILHFLSNLVRHPHFSPADLDKEREVVLGEYDRNESNPYGALNREMTKRLFYKYPWTKDPMGSRHNIEQATAEQLKDFFLRYWAPNNSALVITGDVAPQEALARAEQFFGDWARGPATFAQQPMVQHPPLPKNEGAVVEAPLSTAMLEIGWIGPSLNQDTRATYAADVFSYIVRQPESRLQRAVVDTGLASSLGFGYFTQRASGPITLIAATTPEKARPLLAALQKEIEHFADADYFSDQQLENAKMLLAADDLFAREKPSEYADTLSFWLSSAGVNYWKTYHTSLSAVSRADIGRYLRAYVTGRPHVTLVVLSPEAQKQVQLKPEEVAR